MSLNDSFIKEVSEEVRRDKFFIYLKKYAWIGILLVLIIVFAVSFNEWNKNKEKINIKSAMASTVLIIKFFLSSTAIRISFACSETFINPTT